MRALFCMISLALVGLLGCSAAPAAIPDAAVATSVALVSTPHAAFVETPCWNDLPDGLAARCGYVTAPENQAKPDGNTISLAVMILRQADREPPGAPTFLLAGGPGQDAIALLTDLLGHWDQLSRNGYPKAEFEGQLRDWMEFRASMDILVDDLAKREFVIFDQRGAGYSQPSLKCRGERYDICYRRLRKSGIDLSAYNTRENAADVEAIRAALGYEKINLQGGSYGTRLALRAMRDFPEHLRAVVLDGVSPPQVDWVVETVARYDKTMEVVFQHCAADPACRRAYPNLKQEFYALMTTLERQSASMSNGDQLHADAFLEVMWNSLYDVTTIRWLPLIVHEAYGGNFAPLETLARLKPDDSGGEAMSWGMNYSVECAEEWSPQHKERLLSAAQGLPAAIRQSAINHFIHMEPLCKTWAVLTEAPECDEPVRSEIPTLLLSGEFDPATPPAFARIAASGLKKHYSYVFPGMGHTDSFFSRCWSSIQSQFLADPSHPPDASCINQMPDGEFVLPE